MGERIELTAADGHEFAAWKDGPASARNGLVVAQEIFGVNNHMRNVCAAFAAAGYAVIAPALFDRTERNVQLGYTPEDVQRGRDLRAKVPDAGVVADLEAAAAALPGKRLGIVGYCWGGTVACTAPPARTASPPPPAGTAGASRRPGPRRRTARCSCISAKRTRAFR
jgi:carboxymethylenebutenolidase